MKINKTISIDQETEILLQMHNLNLSEFIRDEVKNRFGGLELLELQLIENEKKHLELLNSIKILKELKEQELKEKPDLSDFQQDKFWAETLRIFKDPEKRASMLQGRTKLYNNLFGKSISSSDFLLLYTEMKERD